MFKKMFSFSSLTLFVALALSTVAEFYSIMGLIAIFAGAVIPVIIMGTTLGVAKVVTTVWLRKYWHRSTLILKLYLVPAVVALAFLTSMGIFGFLSKAHMDQGLTSGDVQAKIAVYDEKIKTSKENIDANRKALKQLDEAVDQVMGRSTDEKGAEKAVAIRRGQTKDRVRLQAEIAVEQKAIASLNEARAPIAAEVRKVEAEVGPIKYIAAFIYGDNPDANLLEKAVRWVIILIVIVFDPLAIALVLAANASKEWDNEEDEKDTPDRIENTPLPVSVADVTPPEPHEEPRDETLGPCYKCDTTLVNAPGIGPFCPNKECNVVDGPFVEDTILVAVDPVTTAEEDEAFDQMNAETVELDVPKLKSELSIEEQMADTVDNVEIEVIPQIVEFEGIKDPVTNEWIRTGPVFEPKTSSSFKDVGDGYVEFEGKKMSKRVLQSMRPDLFNLKEDNPREIEIGFGSSLPSAAKMGDTFIRIDTMPHVVYKNNGNKWIELNKESTGAYLGNVAYLHFLMEKISTGEYDPELLTDIEQDAITNHIKVT